MCSVNRKKNSEDTRKHKLECAMNPPIYNMPMWSGLMLGISEKHTKVSEISTLSPNASDAVLISHEITYLIVLG
jgi:hypothetical protein